MEQRTYQPNADQQSAQETMDKTEALLRAMFDLDELARYLREPDVGAINLADFEKPLDYGDMPETFKPQFYATVGAPGGGIQATPTELIFVQGLDTHRSVPAFDKREDAHRGAHTYKLRGARHAILHFLSESPKKHTFVTASAGNHAISTAQTINSLKGLKPEHPLHTAVYCRTNIAPVKQQKLRALGVTLHPDYNTLEGALSAAQDASQGADTAMVHPFDDEPTIAGQATLVLEYIAQLKTMGHDIKNKPLRLRLPVGGGGLFTGAAVAWRWLKTNDIIAPESELISVEVEQNDSVTREIEGSEPLTEVSLDTDADGTATLQGGRKTVPVIAETADRMQVVPKEYLVRACGILASAHEGKAPELAGSLSLAGLLLAIDTEEATSYTPWHELTVTTGANVDPTILKRLGDEYAAHPDARVATAAFALRAVAARGRAMYNPRDEKQPTDKKPKTDKPTTNLRRTLRVWDGLGR